MSGARIANIVTQRIKSAIADTIFIGNYQDRIIGSVQTERGESMKKKKLKRRIESMEIEIECLKARPDCKYCENHKPKTVKYRRWRPLDGDVPFQVDYLREE